MGREIISFIFIEITNAKSLIKKFAKVIKYMRSEGLVNHDQEHELRFE